MAFSTVGLLPGGRKVILCPCTNVIGMGYQWHWLAADGSGDVESPTGVGGFDAAEAYNDAFRRWPGINLNLGVSRWG